MSKNFTVTCNLLSQYIKEKGRSFGDLALIGKNDTYRAPTTMSLLPGVDVSGDDTKENVWVRNATKSVDLFPQRAGLGLQAPPPPVENREAEKAPMTIFYGGKVLVFDNFPADKARDLMMLAGAGSGIAKNTGVAHPATASPAAPPPAAAQNAPLRPAQANASGLPIARKVSLHRFLEKRKDRINSRAPYQAKKDYPPAVANRKMEENQPWLALTPSLSSECSR